MMKKYIVGRIKISYISKNYLLNGSILQNIAFAENQNDIDIGSRGLIKFSNYKI